MTVLPLVPRRDGDALARRVADDFARRGARLADAAARTHARADDEAVHDLRVTTRRLEAALDLWRGALPPRRTRRLRRSLRQLRREAGPVREREVLAARLRGRLDGLDPEDRVAVERLVQRLDRRTARAHRSLAEAVTPARMERILRRLERVAAALPQTLTPPPDPLADPVARLSRRRAAALDALLHASTTLDDEPLHAARIALKRWRYAEEAMAVARERPARASTRGLRGLQQALGDVHDTAGLRDRLLRETSRLQQRGQSHAAASLASLASRLEAERVEAVMHFRSHAGPMLAPASGD